MTPEDRKAVREFAAKTKGDLTKAAVKWLGSVSGEGNTVELEYNANPEGFAASVGAIVNEVEQYKDLDAEAEAAAAATTETATEEAADDKTKGTPKK